MGVRDDEEKSVEKQKYLIVVNPHYLRDLRFAAHSFLNYFVGTPLTKPIESYN